jgi:hypothetical protein
MSRNSAKGLGSVVIGALLSAGCSAMQIQYVPLTTPSPAAKANVAVKVVDARAPDHGGENKKQVGQVRGSFGIPSGVEDEKEDVAPRTVQDATTDALRHAGVGVQTAAGKTLVSTLKSYWMDGYMGYKAEVAVHFELKDAGGKSLWTSDAEGGAGGTTIGQNPKNMTKDMFERALDELASRASEQFASPAFQQALSTP